MTAPPPYPRVAHLFPGPGSSDDINLDADEVAALLASEVVVEEKLDGANVVLWLDDDGRVQCALRSGPGSMDRAGQLGPLRAWVAGHDEPLRSAFSGYRVLYAEWLFLAHSLAYDRLPSFLIVIDFWRGEEGFASTERRNALCAESGLVAPPELWRGVPNGIGAVERLFGRSAWGSGPAEGLVVRRDDDAADAPRLGKLLAPGFDRLGDDDWRRGRPRNRLAEAATWGGAIETSSPGHEQIPPTLTPPTSG
jgi:RNA ligase